MLTGCHKGCRKRKIEKENYSTLSEETVILDLFDETLKVANLNDKLLLTTPIYIMRAIYGLITRIESHSLVYVCDKLPL